MLKLFICFLVVQAVAAHRSWGNQHPSWGNQHPSWDNHHPSYCNHKHHDYKYMQNNNNQFYELSWDVVRLDRKSRNLCRKTENSARETYFANSYKLSVPLSDFNEEEISVKVRHRVLYIEAYRESDRKLFTELKILPVFVKASDAAWTFADGTLDIDIPYKFALGQETLKTCDDPINEAEIVIQKADGIDVRFGSSAESSTNTADSTPAPPPVSDNVV